MSKETQPATFAYDGLDRIIHEKARLGIMTSLISHPGGLGFTELKQLCNLTDGNLSRHIGVLQEAGLINVKKSFVANKPHTNCTLSAKGRREFTKYLQVLGQIVKAASSPEATDRVRKPGTAT